MMNQPLRRVDPLGRSTPLSTAPANWPWASTPTAGSVSPIGGGSERAIVDSPAPGTRDRSYLRTEGTSQLSTL